MRIEVPHDAAEVGDNLNSDVVKKFERCLHSRHELYGLRTEHTRYKIIYQAHREELRGVGWPAADDTDGRRPNETEIVVAIIQAMAESWCLIDTESAASWLGFEYWNDLHKDHEERGLALAEAAAK